MFVQAAGSACGRVWRICRSPLRAARFPVRTACARSHGAAAGSFVTFPPVALATYATLMRRIAAAPPLSLLLCHTILTLRNMYASTLHAVPFVRPLCFLQNTNQLTVLPSGVFAGLTSMSSIHLVRMRMQTLLRTETLTEPPEDVVLTRCRVSLHLRIACCFAVSPVKGCFVSRVAGAAISRPASGVVCMVHAWPWLASYPV